MVQILNKYRNLIIVLALILLIAIVFVFYTMQNSTKVPSRGVFVLGIANYWLS